VDLKWGWPSAPASHITQAGEVIMIFSTVEDAYRWLGLE